MRTRFLAPSSFILHPSSFIVAALLAACGTHSADTDASPDVRSLTQAVDAAAARYDVPAPLLAGIGYVETRGWMHPGTASIDGAYGPMHLVDRGPGSPLQRAAALAGLSPDALRTDLAANLLGGAALLREIADRTFGPGRGSDDLAQWWPVLTAYSGESDPGLASLFAGDVLRAVSRGASAILPDGGRFRLPPQELTFSGENLFDASEQALAPDYPSAEWRPANSGNYTGGRGGNPINLVVIHTAQGSYSGTISWFANPSASASSHYVVAADGRVASMVHDRDTAWHAGNWDYNQRSIGIEHEGFVADPNWATESMYRASADLVRWVCDTYGVPKDRSHIIGHNEVPDPRAGHEGQYGGSGHHSDPCVNVSGSPCYWDWNHYMSLVGGSQPPQNGYIKGTVFAADGGCQYNNGWQNCTGHEIAGAHVRVPETGADVVTGSDGKFSIALPAGSYHPVASASGFTDGTPVLGAERAVAANATTWSSFILQRAEPPKPTTGTVSGFVYATKPGDDADRTTRLAGVHVAIGGIAADTGGDGSFKLENVPEGPHALGASLAGYAPAQTTVEVVAAQDKTVEVGLTRIAGVDGRVRNAATGDPVEKAVVQVDDKTATSGSDGTYSLDLPAGAYTLQVQAAGYQARSASATVAEAMRTTLDIWILPGDAPALVTITSPRNGAELEATPVAVTGAATLKGVETVSVNGVAADLAEDGSFSAKVTLQEGSNTIQATARTSDGLEVSASVRVNFDTGCGCGSGGPAGLFALPALLALRRRRS